MATAVKLVDPKDNELLASLEARGKQANLFFRAMAHRPEVLKNFPPFYTAIVGPGSVARRLKVLVYLACSYANRCQYCISTNLPGARKAGITGEEILAVEAEKNEIFPAEERAALRYARELTRTASAVETRVALAAHFTDEQIVEITLLIGLANFTNRFNNGLQILPETGQSS
ncbi:MAG: carboxymuconolactone decarboxylase family protein [Bryobacteraceae bacterium]|jgi:AhpD family alkylhydroperoxidase